MKKTDNILTSTDYILISQVGTATSWVQITATDKKGSLYNKSKFPIYFAETWSEPSPIPSDDYNALKLQPLAFVLKPHSSIIYYDLEAIDNLWAIGTIGRATWGEPNIRQQVLSKSPGAPT